MTSRAKLTRSRRVAQKEAERLHDRRAMKTNRSGGSVAVIQNGLGCPGCDHNHNLFNGGGGRHSGSGSGTTHGGGSEPKRPSGPPMKLEGKTYEKIKAQCLRENRLFVDQDFPATDSSISPRRPSQPFEWKRPGVSNFCTIYSRRPGRGNNNSCSIYGSILFSHWLYQLAPVPQSENFSARANAGGVESENAENGLENGELQTY